jgi:ElaA protein
MSEATINWTWKRFEDFSSADLYSMLAARIDVFVVEQRCFYQELDGLDSSALHLCGFSEGRLAAYLRLLPPGERFGGPSIGRVMTVALARDAGLGRELMITGIRGCRKYFPDEFLFVSAQAHLEAFYMSLGFVTISEPYDEDGIPHVDMELQPGIGVPGLD